MLLAFLEPIGSAAPKFNVKDKINAFIGKAHSKFALLCPAQGSPIPAFRLVFCSIPKVVHFSEPVTQTVPKFPEIMKTKDSVDAENQIALSCPAQAYPSPGFR